MSVIIGSARHDERNSYTNGAKGDSLQTSTPDYKGEVSMQNFYVHKKGWNVLRPKDSSVAHKIAENMKTACNNKNLGYSQSDRYGVIKNGIKTAIPSNCDCSSLVRACVKEASGKDPGDFTTANAIQKLSATGLFEAPFPYSYDTPLHEGDILCTKTKGHIVIVTESSNSRPVTKPLKQMKISKKGLELIKSFESCQLTAYKAVPTEKYYTIGWGHNGADVKAGMVISSAQADAYLAVDIARFEKAVNDTGLNLNQNQFDALISFAYNCGAGNLKKLCEDRTLPQIADKLLAYNKAGGKVLAGLTRRRQAERNLFLSGGANTVLQDNPNRNPYPEPTKNVRLNTRGNDARWVQVALGRKGYKLVVDGICGEKTIAALKDFQSKNNLVVDGICGEKTRKMLI